MLVKLPGFDEGSGRHNYDREVQQERDIDREAARESEYRMKNEHSWDESNGERDGDREVEQVRNIKDDGVRESKDRRGDERAHESGYSDVDREKSPGESTRCGKRR